MSKEIQVPMLGESVAEATVAQWFKQEGEEVAADEPLVALETDKVTVEVAAPSAGMLLQIVAKDGDTVEVGALLGTIGESNGRTAPTSRAVPARTKTSASDVPLSPAVRKVVEENELDVSRIKGTGKGGRITKADALAALKSAPATASATKVAKASTVQSAPRAEDRREERVPMTRLRQTIAARLKEAQNKAAMLTTFNEVDMSRIMALRKEYKEIFEKKHGVKLGFMSFFLKASVAALQDIPTVNAEIDGTDLVYKNYYDIGVAVSTDKGLVVPVLRDADKLSLANIEKAINDFAFRAREGALKLNELQGGTFTISNGGVYGSLMSTPILNSPQSGILGMHKVQERPVVVDGEIVVRPMMYLALSYDHRIVDGKEAVTFLVRIKECLEEPDRLTLDL